MNGYSFIVVTDGNQPDRLKLVIESITREVPKERLDLIIVGGTHLDKNLIDLYNIYFIPFNEQEYPNAIGRKKNIGVRAAKFDRLVISHDYIEYLPGYIKAWDEFGDSWDLGMNVILNKDGSRYRDWLIFFSSKIGPKWTQQEPWQPQPKFYDGSPYLIPYNQDGADMISGAYFLAKKHVMLVEPILEIPWGLGEDVEWSGRVIPKYKYVMNSGSRVKLLKKKNRIFPIIED